MIKLDAADLRILAALQNRGRTSKLKLAEAAHLSPASCWERLRRLEETGVIAGYAARIAIEKVARVTTMSSNVMPWAAGWITCCASSCRISMPISA